MPWRCGSRRPDREYAVVKRCRDLIADDLARQGDGVLELPDAAALLTHEAFAFALFHFAVHGQLAVVPGQGDVVAGDAGQVDLDDVGVVGLLDVDRER